MTNQRNAKASYIVTDFFMAVFSWTCFFIFRKHVIEQLDFSQVSIQMLHDSKFYLGITLIPLCWLFAYYLSGYYNFIFNKNKTTDILSTFQTVFVGTIVIFFLFLLDDQVRNYKNYYITFSTLFAIQYLFTLSGRWIITTSKQRKVRKNQLSFDTIIVGCQEQAKNIFDELTLKKANYGNHFIGYIRTSENSTASKLEDLPCLGTIQDFPDIINEHNPTEIIIATESSESEKTKEILNWLGYSEITVKIVAEISSHLKGQVKITNILGTALFEIDHQLMPLWQQALKASIDFIGAFIAILLFSPLFLIISIGVKATSKGPIFFRQERVGKNGRPFVLYKFRSMYIDAEKNGPNLSTQNDRRCTPFGRLLRQTKLDEIPNFYNVLKGDMSLVGPRPERQHYIEQIIKITPNYKQLQKIKPGITSLGQVRYGYASDVEQMVKRLRYDLIYLENMSLRTDFLVIYYTIVIIFKGRHI